MRVVVVALMLGIALPVGAQELKPPANLFGQKKVPPKPPVVDWSWRPSPESHSAGTPKVVCGMTLVPADPIVDRKMRVVAPNEGTQFTLRAIQPTVCRP
jgi:hypothetical protein